MCYDIGIFPCPHIIFSLLLPPTTVSAGDKKSAAAFKQIQFEEISHVHAGYRWFQYVCDESKIDPIPIFHKLVRRHFGGQLRAPFAVKERLAAGMSEDWYVPLSLNKQPVVAAEGESAPVEKKSVAEIMAARRKRKEAEQAAQTTTETKPDGSVIPEQDANNQ